MKTRGMELWEYKRGESIEAILRRELAAGQSVRAIAASLQVSQVTIYDWVKLLGYRIVRRGELVPRADEGEVIGC